MVRGVLPCGMPVRRQWFPVGCGCAYHRPQSTPGCAEHGLWLTMLPLPRAQSPGLWRPAVPTAPCARRPQRRPLYTQGPAIRNMFKWCDMCGWRTDKCGRDLRTTDISIFLCGWQRSSAWRCSYFQFIRCRRLWPLGVRAPAAFQALSGPVLGRQRHTYILRMDNAHLGRKKM